MLNPKESDAVTFICEVWDTTTTFDLNAQQEKQYFNTIYVKHEKLIHFTLPQ